VVTHIGGTATEDNDNDPVEVRQYQILGTTLDEAIGYPTTPIWHGGGFYWRYFERGMIVSGPGACASVLYGPILDFYGTVGQFHGQLGSAASDVSLLPDGTSYAVFENGVVWVDGEGNAGELSPLAPALVKAFGGLDPSAEGIAKFAQEKIQSMAQSALESSQHLRENVNQITVSVNFVETGEGSCRGAGFSSAGHSLTRSHVFHAHFEFGLTGCAGTFGGASADLRVVVRLQVAPPTVSAFMESFDIEAVSSPFGAGDGDITQALSNQLVNQYGKDLIGKTLPSGFNVLAGLVDREGEANVYIEPLCTTSSILSRSERPEVDATLNRLREVRDAHLTHTPHGRDLVAIVDAFGGILLAALRRHPDGERLRRWLGDLLVEAAGRPHAPSALAERLAEPARQMSELLALASDRGGFETIEHLAERGVAFVGDAAGTEGDLDAVLGALGPVLEEQIRDLRAGAATA
jgi:hypothetical protein